ncbi:MAG: plasmid stabilization system [Microvirga sp.]|nr:plasmid stabilization system [Microvirga sp.]
MKLRYTRPALADLEELASYLEARSPQGALRVRRRIKFLIDQLADHPFLGKRTVDAAIRRLTATPYPYLIFYEVTEGEVLIHAVRHGARDPSTPTK